ncbi:hypothetical protein ACHAXA_000720, partial [Cyclostephanos tholiformis]
RERVDADLSHSVLHTAMSIVLPTYHLKPEDENARFSESKARHIVKEILDSELQWRVDNKWDKQIFETLSKSIADKIKEQCKTSMNIPRYKIIVQVTIGQMKDQGIKITSRCLWDTATDNYASVSFQKQHIWASAIVFAMYTD